MASIGHRWDMRENETKPTYWVGYLNLSQLCSLKTGVSVDRAVSVARKSIQRSPIGLEARASRTFRRRCVAAAR